MSSPVAPGAPRRRCGICGNADGNREFLAREMQFGTREAFPYFQCADCGCLQIAEVPGDLSRHYPEDYYSARALDERKYRGLRGRLRVLPFEASLFQDTPFRKALAGVAPRRHFHCLAGLGIGRKTRILDVGCGNGKSFLYPLKRMGFERVSGCDAFLPEDLRYANGLWIAAVGVEKIGSATPWDLVTFHHSFEHMPDPLGTLGNVARLLGDGGRCLVRVPIVSSFAWEHYGVDWVQLDAPRHLFLHSIESMRRLADAAGFRLERIVYDSHSIQFWGSEAYASGVALKEHRKGKGLARIAWSFRRWRLSRRAAALNREGRGDQAAFVLAKTAPGARAEP